MFVPATLRPNCNMRYSGKFIALWVVLAAAVLLAAAMLAAPTYSLDLTYFDSGEPLLSVPLEKGERFNIHYMHSVDISPVVEVFALGKDGSLMLEESRFRMFGAGFDHWRGHGELIGDNGWERIVNIDQPLESFILRVGQKGVDHTLAYRGREINLTEVAAGKRVTISVRRESRLERWFH